MKRILFYCLLISSCISFSQKIEGEIENVSKKIDIELTTLGDKSIKRFEVKRGRFKTSNLGVKEGYYIFRVDNEMIHVYLKPTDDFIISFNAKSLINTVIFLGKGSKKNNYLIQKERIEIEKEKEVEQFYEGDEKEYLRKIVEVKTEVLALLKSSKQEEIFNEREKKNLKYGYLFNLLNYGNHKKLDYGKITGPSKDFLKPLSSVNFDDAILYNTYPNYRSLSSLKWKKEIENAVGFTEMEKIFTSIKSESIKKEVVISFFYAISKNRDKSEYYFELIKKYVPNRRLISMARKQLKGIKQTSIGNISPNFIYKDIKGKEVNLQGFKGKYVLIDIWATWCTPCVKEFPYLKKLEHKYENKNIAFISISVDDKKEYSLWKKMIKSRDLKGIQLLADNSFESKFIEAYSIVSIPRFILLSPEGKIIENRMSKPSKGSMEKLLDGLLN